MGRFDESTWKARSWDRFSKTIQRGGDKSLAEAQWTSDYLSIGDLKRLLVWTSEHNLTVDFLGKGGGVYDVTNNFIVISSRLSPLKQVAYLLHESGHHLIFKSDESARYAMGYAAEGQHVKKTLRHRFAVLDEELEAWWRGWKLAERLGLSITLDEYETVKVECVKTYVKWAAGKGAWEAEVT